MIRMKDAVAIAAVLSLVAVEALLQAQTSPTVAARHVRIVPIRVARLVSPPVVDAPGTSSALRVARGADIIGIVQNTFGEPVPNAGTAVVRNLETGTIVESAPIGGSAQFTIRGLEPGLYSVDIVGPNGGVVASTPAFSAAAGDVIHVAPTIPGVPAQGLLPALRSATSAAISAAASLGVLATRQGAPVTPRS